MQNVQCILLILMFATVDDANLSVFLIVLVKIVVLKIMKQFVWFLYRHLMVDLSRC